MGFLVMILNYIIIGKFSVSFHDIIFLGFHYFLFVSLFRSSLFIFPNQISFDLVVTLSCLWIQD